MRRAHVAVAFIALILMPGIASAKLPFFGLEVNTVRPSVGEPITLTMTCYQDEGHTRPTHSRLGAGGTMAWVHPLDDDGALRMSDWIPVEGRSTASGATQGRVTLNEPGSYDVLPLWRRWGPVPSPGFPVPTRIEVIQPGRTIPWAVLVLGVAVIGAGTAARRRPTFLPLR